ncbi:hypothetical protein ACIPVB_05415 [Microbacterium sp. NPDC090007]|uniref:hypothetical protein n=1 Tax=Microbacterium sp. NPDC090007 TaxID=3364204 RepID=UPI0038070EB3
MSRITRLAPGIGAVALRRLTRTQQVTWPRWRLYLPLLLAGAGALALGTVAIRSHPPDDPLLTSLYPPAAGVVVAFLAGAGVMAMEATCDRSGSLECALAGLPIRPREAAFLVHLPSLVIGGLVVTVPLAPAVAALLSIGRPLPDTLLFVTMSLTAGLVTIGMPYLGVSVLLRSARWDAVRFPTVLLVWAGAFGAQTVYALRALSNEESLAPLPLTVTLVKTLRGTLTAGTAVTIIVAGMGVAVVVAAFFLFSRSAGRAPLVRARWMGSHRVWGELLYTLRDPSVRANVVLAALTNVFLAVVYFWIPSEVRAQAESIVLLPVGIFAVAAARPIRGLYPGSIPVQRRLVMAPTSWALSTSFVVAAVAAATCAPAVTLVFGSPDPAATILRLIGTWAVSSAVAVGVGASMPVGPRNVLGHGLSGGISIGLYLALSLTFQPLGLDRAGLLVALSVVVLATSVLLAVIAERVRWRPTISEERDLST